MAEERGIPGEIATVVVAHAGWLLERGHADRASALIGRAAPWADQDFDLAALQARLLRSPAIGSASGRERVWPYVSITVVAGSLKKKKKSDRDKGKINN